MSRRLTGRIVLGAVVLLVLHAGAATASIVTATVVAPTQPFSSPGYTPNGLLNVFVEDSPGCAGATYNVNAQPIAGSGPDGSNPPATILTDYFGVPAGHFPFAQAGVGVYVVTVTTIAGCTEGASVLTIGVPNGAPAGAPAAGWFGLVGLALALAGAGALRIRRRGI
jgi:hypothetical protein